MRRCLGVVLACLLPVAAWAHSSSTSYVTIVASGHDGSLQWSIALRDLDMAIGQVTETSPDSPAVVSLTGCYHNLLRRWSQV